MGLFTSSKKERIVAIFDIGSGSVGGAITRIPADGKEIPTIIKSARTEVPIRDDLNFSVLLEDMLLALNATATSLYEGKVGVPDEIVCVLASPWYLSETRIIKIAKEHSFVFTKKLADESLSKEISALKSSYENKYGGVKSAPEVMEHHVMGISLNGYLVDDPIGKRSKSVEMHMFISLSPKSCLDKIRQTLSNTFHEMPISFSSFVMSSYLAVRDKYVTPESYLLLDIGGEVTDVAIISKGMLTASLSFPFGKNTFFKYIYTKMEIELRDAKELFKLFSTNSLAAKNKQKAESLFKSI